MSSNKVFTEDEIKQAIEDIFFDKYHFALLLGSAATERFHSESDIDIAVYFKTEIPSEELSKLSLQLEEAFAWDCDLIQLNKTDTIFARQVLETGREISIVNRPFFNVWKAEQLAKYPDFKQSRKIIEDNLLNRKKYV